jgi:hypothetical protein
MMSEFPHIIRAAIVFMLMVLIAFSGFAYAWRKWRTDVRKGELPRWRRTATGIGFVAVAAQAALFVAFVGPIGRDYVLFAWWARAVLALFVVALPLTLAGRGASRWWLLGSSLLLFIICFFMILSK